jgi:hypothetical protein
MVLSPILQPSFAQFGVFAEFERSIETRDDGGPERRFLSSRWRRDR